MLPRFPIPSPPPIIAPVKSQMAHVTKALEVEKAEVFRVVIQMGAVQLDFLTRPGMRFTALGSAFLTLAPAPYEPDEVADL